MLLEKLSARGDWRRLLSLALIGAAIGFRPACLFAQNPTALEAPASVAASDGAYTSKIAVTWDPVPHAKTYRVLRNSVNDSATAVPIGVTSSWVFWDVNAPVGPTLFYWVRAENGESLSGFSASDPGFRARATAGGAAGTTLEPPNEPAGNPVTAAKVALGKVLFWDEQLSSTNTVACGTCHLPEKGGADPRALPGATRALHFGPDRIAGTADDVIGSPGVRLTRADGEYIWDEVRGFQEQVTGRSTRPMTDAAYFVELFWDGRASGVFRDPVTNVVVLASGGALESQSLAPVLSTTEMAHAGRTWEDVVGKLTSAWPLALATHLPGGLARWIDGRTYPQLFDDAFGTPEITPVRLAFALAAYERTLFSDRTPFDEASALIRDRSVAAARGLTTFNTHTCVTCHAGVTFSDGLPHHLGVRPVGEPEDAGRFDATALAADRGKFITASLRNVALRGTFMHTGGLTSLDAVLRFYDRGGDFNSTANEIRGINLNNQERSDLIAFFDTLTDPRARTRQFPFDRPTLFTESNRGPFVAGAGVAGSGGNVPRALAVDPPYLGNTRFNLAVDGALGGGTAILVIDTSEPPLDRIPIAAEVSARFSLTLEGRGAGQGHAAVRWPVPDQQALAGTRFFSRWYVLDPAASNGIAASARVDFTLFGEHGAIENSGAARLASLSARVLVGGEGGTPITGIVVAGPGGKRVIIRAVGPTLAGFGVTGTLAAPSMELVQDGNVINTSSSWRAEDAPAFATVGAFALTAGSKDAALITTLAPGNTSVPVRSADGGSGIALLEIYDTEGATSTSRLSALSTRAHVGTGAAVLIGGFTVLGDGQATILLRAVGPTLAVFGVSNPLSDPQITLYRSGAILAANDDWSNSSNATAIQSAATRVGGFVLAQGSRDAALLLTVPAGNYTAVVNGNGGTTGTALFEIYVVP